MSWPSAFLHRRRYPDRYALLQMLLTRQHLSIAEAEVAQQADLTAILHHAATAVPYYRERVSVDAPLADWTVLTKALIREYREDLVVDGVAREGLKTLHTGGSTGEPLAFYYDAAKHTLMRAGMMRSYRGAGWRPGDKILNFWGARQDVKPLSLGQRWAEWVSAEQTVPAWDFNESDLDHWVRKIQRERPVLLQGYASVLAALAQFVVTQRRILPSSIKGVFSTAEVLYASQRAVIQTAFSCPVFNQYGSREVPNIACECAHGQMHVFTDMVHLESVGTDHALLVTSLTNRLFPFIRYQNGDTGRIRPAGCACGSPFPILEIGVCRSNDIVTTTSGRRIYPSWFVHLLDGLSVQQFQFVQEAFDRMVLHWVGAPLNRETLAALQARIHVEVDVGMTLEVRPCAEISRGTSGKHRFVVALGDSRGLA